MNELLPAALKPYAPLIVGAAKALLIFAVGWVVSKWAAALVARSLKRSKVDQAVARFLGSLAQYVVLAAAIVAALGTVGVQTTSLVAILGAMGLAIGFALQGTLGHFASGVMLLLFRPFTIDDVVTIGGHTGKVTEIGLFATTLVAFDNLRITIPNGTITSGTITNMTVMGTRRIEIEIGIGYDEDPEAATEVILAAAREVEGALDDPEPAVIVAGFGASSVNLKAWVWAKTADFGPVANRSKIAIFKALGRAGIEIPFDQLVVHKAAS